MSHSDALRSMIRWALLEQRKTSAEIEALEARLQELQEQVVESVVAGTIKP